MPLIVLEGIDGSGKTVQVEQLKQQLKPEVVFIREPGGTQISELLRRLLLDPALNFSSNTELLTFLAARSQLIAERLAPASAKNKLIVMDRFYYSTIAYQIVGLDLPNKNMWIDLIKTIVNNIEPDLLFWLDIPLEKSLERLASKTKDSVENRSMPYQIRVYEAYQELMEICGIKIDGTKPPHQVNEEILRHIKLKYPDFCL